MQTVEPGDRVTLLAVFNDPKPLMVGESGTVVGVEGFGLGDGHWKVLDVCWDSCPAKSYCLVSPPDIVLVENRKENHGDIPGRLDP